MKNAVIVGIALGAVATLREVLGLMPIPFMLPPVPSLVFGVVAIGLSAVGLRDKGLRPQATIGLILGFAPLVLFGIELATRTA